jgi:hypothetical protein
MERRFTSREFRRESQRERCTSCERGNFQRKVEGMNSPYQCTFFCRKNFHIVESHSNENWILQPYLICTQIYLHDTDDEAIVRLEWNSLIWNCLFSSTLLVRHGEAREGCKRWRIMWRLKWKDDLQPISQSEFWELRPTEYRPSPFHIHANKSHPSHIGFSSTSYPCPKKHLSSDNK